MEKIFAINESLTNFIINYVSCLIKPLTFKPDELNTLMDSHERLVYAYNILSSLITRPIKLIFDITNLGDKKSELEISIDEDYYSFHILAENKLIFNEGKILDNSFTIADSSNTFITLGKQDGKAIRAKMISSGISHYIEGLSTHDIDRHLYMFNMSDEQTKGVKLSYDLEVQDDCGLPFSLQALQLRALLNINLINSNLITYDEFKYLKDPLPVITYYSDEHEGMDIIYAPKKNSYYNFIINGNAYYASPDNQSFNITSGRIINNKKIMENPYNWCLFDNIVIDNNDNIRCQYDLQSNALLHDHLITSINELINKFRETHKDKNGLQTLEVKDDWLTQVLELNLDNQKPQVILIGGILSQIIKCDIKLLKRIQKIIQQDIFDINNIIKAYEEYSQRLKSILPDTKVDYQKIYS